MKPDSVPPVWRLVRVDQTAHCNAEWLAEKGIAASDEIRKYLGGNPVCFETRKPTKVKHV